METLSASDAKREFGEVILKAQQGPVCINKNGKPAAVVISTSAFKEFQTLQREVLKHEIQIGIDDVEADRVVDGQVVMDELRQQITDAEL